MRAQCVSVCLSFRTSRKRPKIKSKQSPVQKKMRKRIFRLNIRKMFLMAWTA